MTILTDLLPYLKGWKFNFQPPTNYVIPAGGFQKTYESSLSFQEPIDGYVFSIGATTNQPTTQLEIYHVGPRNQMRTIVGSPFALNAGGMNAYNAGFWCPVYNAILGIYSAIYQPNSHLGFWSDYMRIRILAPVGVASIVTGYFHRFVEVYDKVAWINSWRKIFQSDVFKLKVPKEE